MPNLFPSGIFRLKVENSAVANLSVGISDVSVSITLTNDETNKPSTLSGISYAFDNFPDPTTGNREVGLLKIENETILYASRTAGVFTVYQENVHMYGILSAGETGRGFQGVGETPSGATTHTAEQAVYHNVSSYEIDEIQSAIVSHNATIITKADDSAVVHVTGDESIAGIKTFEDDKARSTTNGAPSDDKSFANKKYVDDNVGSTGYNFTVVTAGENVDGSTTPQAVYISDSTGGRTLGRYYRCDANDTTNTDANNFWGFVKSNKTTGQTDNVIPNGIVNGFTGLTVAALYYLSDTAGAISATPSTTSQEPVGIAISATEIVIQSLGKKLLLYGLNFGGNGSDGALSVVAGTTNISLNQIYNYSSIAIDAGATLSTNDTDGSMILKSKGNVTVEGTIDLKGKGTLAGVGGGAGNGGGGGAGGTGGNALIKYRYLIDDSGSVLVALGSGGASSGGGAGSAGTGGGGGAGLLSVCGGGLDFDGGGVIDCSGADATDGLNATNGNGGNAGSKGGLNATLGQNDLMLTLTSQIPDAGGAGGGAGNEAADGTDGARSLYSFYDNHGEKGTTNAGGTQAGDNGVAGNYLLISIKDLLL